MSGSERLIDPTSFSWFGFCNYVSTNGVDPVDGTIHPVPLIMDNGDGTLTVDLSSWDQTHCGTHVNQGAPKPAGGNPAPSGTYDPVSGAYTLSWNSLIIGGPYNGFTGEWSLTGHFVPAVPDCDDDGVADDADNCVCQANPDQTDSDADGYGDRCDCDPSDPQIHPNAMEICGNHMDENCDGVAEVCTDHDVAVTSVRVPKKVRDCTARPKKIRAEVANPGKLTEVIYVRLTSNGARLAGQSVVLDPGGTARVTFDVYPNLLALGSAEICVEGIIQRTDLMPGDNKACGVMSVVGCE